MGILDDVMKTLDRIPLWKRLGEVPGEVDELNRRVSALEGKLNGKWPADVCRYCGERAVRLESIRGPNSKGMLQEDWECAACGQSDQRLTKGR